MAYHVTFLLNDVSIKLRQTRTLRASAPLYSQCCPSSPRGVLLLFCLYHVTETSIGKCLSEVRVWRHEAVVVEAWMQAGRAETEGLALRTAGSTKHALILGGQVGAKQGLQQLKGKFLLL